MFSYQFIEYWENEVEGFPAHGGLNFELVRDGLNSVLEIIGFKNEIKEKLCHDICTWDEAFPKRIPTFCPGCPHRETLSLLKDLRKLEREGIQLEIESIKNGIWEALQQYLPYYEQRRVELDQDNPYEMKGRVDFLERILKEYEFQEGSS